MKVKKNDKVLIIKGKDRGKTGKVLTVFEKGRVIVEGLNMSKKTVRPRTTEEKGQVISVAKPVAIANVQVVCPSCGKPTRIGYDTNSKSGNKKRICKKCQASL
ncbi:MAG: 50S ribosomal protein L24 [Patescibacteria group bacterium]|nr:50S ribosomal protein L24 [Patescibacteria group bacterium]